MQWLIDMVIEAIGVPPCSIDRGDPADLDLLKADFFTDGAWHEHDLSAVVPEGAKAINVTVKYSANAVGREIKFRKHGNTNERNVLQGSNPVANLPYMMNGLIEVDADRKIESNVEAGLYTYINFTIRRWIL